MKGLDVDSDPSVWLPIPREWTTNTWPDHRDWARDAAEAVFHGSRDRREVDILAGLLAFLAEDPKIAPGQTQSSYLHLPGPGTDVLPVYVQFFDSEGARDEALREMAEADGDAVKPPSVEPFATLAAQHPKLWQACAQAYSAEREPTPLSPGGRGVGGEGAGSVTRESLILW